MKQTPLIMKFMLIHITVILGQTFSKCVWFYSRQLIVPLRPQSDRCQVDQHAKVCQSTNFSSATDEYGWDQVLFCVCCLCDQMNFKTSVYNTIWMQAGVCRWPMSNPIQQGKGYGLGQCQLACRYCVVLLNKNQTLKKVEIHEIPVIVYRPTCSMKIIIRPEFILQFL